MTDLKREKGWCRECGMVAVAARDEDDWLCEVCGCHLIKLSEVTEDEKAVVEMQQWFAGVCRKGLNGPSPGGAASMLGCSRSMIDRLVERGVLERSEFAFKGQKLVIISRRSLETAKQNRDRTGNWTGSPVRRGG